MKPAPFTAQPKSIIVIYADDKVGLLGQLLNLFNRPSYKIGSLNVARTDVNGVVLITLEVTIAGQPLKTMLHKLERIVEVYRAASWTAEEAGLTKVGFYRVSQDMLDDQLWQRLQKHGATITKIFDDSLVIQNTGNTESLQMLYNELDGKYLLSYCETSLIVERSLLKLDELFTFHKI